MQHLWMDAWPNFPGLKVGKIKAFLPFWLFGGFGYKSLHCRGVRLFPSYRRFTQTVVSYRIQKRLNFKHFNQSAKSRKLLWPRGTKPGPPRLFIICPRPRNASLLRVIRDEVEWWVGKRNRPNIKKENRGAEYRRAKIYSLKERRGNIICIPSFFKGIYHIQKMVAIKIETVFLSSLSLSLAATLVIIPKGI